ncbi:hypothetical protein DXG01_000985 [Tephrocybe rancida]|nr:hypothetical protein DXG01_000985 [Tephrocybe rancida]
MPPRMPPNTKLEQEWLLNEDHEWQERKRDQARLNALLAQQMLVLTSTPPVSTSPRNDAPHVALIIGVFLRSASLPPMLTLTIRRSPHASPVEGVSLQSLSPASGSSLAETSSGHPVAESSVKDNKVSEHNELDGKGEVGNKSKELPKDEVSKHDKLDSQSEVGSESDEVRGDLEEWGGILTNTPGSDLMHLEFVSNKLFFEVMRALCSEDPPAAWCVSARLSVLPLFLSAADTLPVHLEVAGPHVPVSDLLAIWQHATAGVPLPKSLSVLFASLLTPAGSSSKRKRSPSPESSEEQRQVSEPTVVRQRVGVKVGTSHLRNALKQQVPTRSQAEVDSEEVVVGQAGVCHLHRAKSQSSLSPSPPPQVPRISLGTPLFLPSLNASSPPSLPWSPIPAPPIPRPPPVEVSPAMTSPADNLLIDLASDIKVSVAAPSPRVVSLSQPQRIHPSPPCYFVEPLEDGEVVDGLEEGLLVMSPSEILGLMQWELESLTPKQLCNLLLCIKGQHQMEFEAFKETARGWQESLAYVQGLAIGEH